MSLPPKHRLRPLLAFSLLEVVVAIGIFATGVVTVVGLFGALAKSVGSNAEVTAAANLGDLLREYLQSRVAAEGSFEPVLRLMPTAVDTTGASPAILYANRVGTRIGEHANPLPGEDLRDEFFAITLRPVDTNGSAPALVLAYIAEVRWPAFGRGGTSGPVPANAPSQQHVLLVGAVGR
jgi:type II secretory pathway pseudopilin PulG